MKAECYIITIETNIKSVNAAERCIASGRKFNIQINIFNAFTPRHNPFEILKNKGINIDKLTMSKKYSFPDGAAGCFLSHFTLWEKCIEINKPVVIFEHDAIITDEIPFNILDGSGFDQLINLGKPAHGKSSLPPFTGVGPLTSTSRFKGTHAYVIKPAGALKLISKAKTTNNKFRGEADVFLNTKSFPFLEELYPWPVYQDISFTTIQHSGNRFAPELILDEFGNTRNMLC